MFSRASFHISFFWQLNLNKSEIDNIGINQTWHRTHPKLSIMTIYNSLGSIWIQWIRVMILRWQSNLVNAKKTYLFVINFITPAKETLAVMVLSIWVKSLYFYLFNINNKKLWYVVFKAKKKALRRHKNKRSQNAMGRRALPSTILCLLFCLVSLNVNQGWFKQITVICVIKCL